MSYPMHTQGVIRAAAKPLWLHLRELIHNPAYRAYHRFSGRLRHRHFEKPVEVRYAGRPILLKDGPSFLSAWDEIFVNQIYDVGDRNPVPRIVDVGANVGLAALYWKHRYGQIRYVGFEPDPEVAALCRANLLAWDCGGELHECAVLGTEGDVLFQSDGADGGRVISNDAGKAACLVRSVRLSSFLQEETDLLKIDIEGAEVGVLGEVAEQLNQVENIFVEVHSTPAQPQPFEIVFRILQRAGYRCFLHPGFGPLQPFSRQIPLQGGYEMLVNVFGTRRNAAGFVKHGASVSA